MLVVRARQIALDLLDIGVVNQRNRTQIGCRIDS
jgi:hypothetical protein